MDQEVAYNWKAKEIRDQQAKVAQKRLDDANKKLIEQRKRQAEFQRQEMMKQKSKKEEDL